jgi:hypothetical protein
MPTGRIARMWLTSCAAALAAALSLAPSALAVPAGTSVRHDRSATIAGSFSASHMSVTLALGWRNAGALQALISAPTPR